MKARPLKKIEKGYVICEPKEATHVHINFPSPSGDLILPVLLSGNRKGTNCWSWNGDTEKPTLKPSIKTTREGFVCHSFLNDGKAQFLSDCTHDLVNQTVDMLEVE